MHVRHPVIDFTGLPAMWAAHRQAVHSINAIGIVPAHIEPYLIKVLRQAREQLDSQQYPDLVADIDVFIKQEAQHLKLHHQMNRAVRDGGYEGMAEIEQAYAADYERFLSTKSLRWNVAYCEGFEAMGCLAAQSMVDGLVFASMSDADPRPIELWKWHLAEEYEHRTVVFRTFHALYGHQPVRAWFTRLRGLSAAGKHIGTNINRVYRYLRRTDGDEAKGDRLLLDAGPGAARAMFAVLSPFYDPARTKPPRDLDAVLARYT